MFGNLRKEVREAISKICKMEDVIINAVMLPDHVSGVYGKKDNIVPNKIRNNGGSKIRCMFKRLVVPINK